MKINNTATQSSNQSYYLHEIHALRAIACLLVLLVHVTACYYLMQGEQFNWLTYGLNQIGRFGTPFFAVISAFLLFYQVRRRGFHIKKFLLSRISKILMPFFVWSGVYLLLNKIYLGVSVKKGLTPMGYFVEYFVLGGAYYHFYFIAMIIQFYLLFMVLQLIRTKSAWIGMLIVGLLLNLAYLYSGEIGIKIDNSYLREIYYDKGFILRWIFHFLFGGFLAYFWEDIKCFLNKVDKLLLPFGIAVIIGAIFEYSIQGSTASYRGSNFINIPILTFVVIGLYPYIRKLRVLEGISDSIGNKSMGIYLVHPLVLFIFMEHIPNFLWSTKWLPIMFVLVLLTCITIIKLVQIIPVSSYILPVPKSAKSKVKQNSMKTLTN